MAMTTADKPGAGKLQSERPARKAPRTAGVSRIPSNGFELGAAFVAGLTLGLVASDQPNRGEAPDLRLHLEDEAEHCCQKTAANSHENERSS